MAGEELSTTTGVVFAGLIAGACDFVFVFVLPATGFVAETATFFGAGTATGFLAAGFFDGAALLLEVDLLAADEAFGRAGFGAAAEDLAFLAVADFLKNSFFAAALPPEGFFEDGLADDMDLPFAVAALLRELEAADLVLTAFLALAFAGGFDGTVFTGFLTDFFFAAFVGILHRLIVGK